MPRILAPLAVLGLLLAAAPAHAEGLCQVRFHGAVLARGAEVPPGAGHLVEVEIGALSAGAAAAKELDLVLHLHLAPGTTGAELAALVAERLERLGIDVVRPGGASSSGSLWIESARYVRLRLGAGLEADVACSEGPPTSLRLLPPSAIRSEASLTVSATTALVLRDRPPMRDLETIELELAPELSSAEAAARLSEAAAEKWIGERPRGDAWRPHKMANGAQITGVSVRLDTVERGGGDWRLEVEL